MPKGAALQYHIRNTAVPGADYDVTPVTANGIDGTGIVLAVIDDGIQTDHPALAPGLNLGLSYDYVSGVQSPAGNARDSHGTAVAGVALGNTAWGGPIGVAPNATLVGLRIAIGTTAVPGTPNVGLTIEEDRTGVMAIAQATRVADIANNSWGGKGVNQKYEGDSAPLDPAFQSAVTTGRGGKGLNLVFAAGNTGDDGDDVSFQAYSSDPRVVTVGGLRPDGTPALDLTHGAGLLVSGAAVDVVTANRYTVAGATPDANGLPTNSYNPITGTSFAAPGVSGVIALMLQANPGLGWRDVQEILVDAAKVPGANAVTKPDGTPWFSTLRTGDWNGGGRHFSNAYGYGLPDADVAVQLAKTWTPYGTSATLVKTTVNGTGGAAVIGGGPIVTSTVAVADSVRIQHVQLTIKAPMLATSDVRLVLTAPDGTSSVVADRAGSRQDFATKPAGVSDPVQFRNTDGTPRFDPAGNPVLNVAPLDFTLNDAGFWGVDSRGTWTLQLVDVRTGESGTIDAWGLTFWGDAQTAPRTLVYTPDFASIVAADPTRAVIAAAGASGTIDAAALSGNTSIDLRGGAGMLGGVAVTVQPGTANAIGGRGITTITGTAKANLLRAGDGNTTITGGGGKDTIMGGAGRNALFASGGGGLVVSGTAGALVGLDRDDVLLGSGPDTVIGGAGLQTAFALSGGTTAFAGQGTLQFINRGAASSTVVGGAGSTIVFGGTAGDLVSGGTAGRNVLLSGSGAATLFGGGDGDVLFAQGGTAGGATQVLRAGLGNETLSGAGSSTGADYFVGAGNVVIGAGDGNDTIFGGAGSATVMGGGGADLFAFKAGSGGGAMLIGSFSAAKGDRITLQGYAADAVQTALSTASTTAFGYTLRLSDNTRISFSNLTSLDAKAFI